MNTELTTTMMDALEAVRGDDVTYTYRPMRPSKNQPKPVTPQDLIPVYSHGLGARTVQALEDRGIVKLSPIDQNHGKVIAVISSNDEPAEPKGPGRVTVSDVKLYPRYYISGAGQEAADASQCEHGYNLTSSCPACP
jgi:hypothetical protein